MSGQMVGRFVGWLDDRGDVQLYKNEWIIIHPSTLCYKYKRKKNVFAVVS